MNRGEVRIDSGDSFSADDHYYFSIERSDPLPVLFVRGREGRDLLYYRTAVESSRDAAFKLESASPAQAAEMPLSRYAFVVLSDVGDIPAALDQALRGYVRARRLAVRCRRPRGGCTPKGAGLGCCHSRCPPQSRDGDQFQTAGHPRHRTSRDPSGRQLVRCEILPLLLAWIPELRAFWRVYPTRLPCSSNSRLAKAACSYSHPLSIASRTTSRCTPDSCRLWTKPHTTWRGSTIVRQT